LKTKIKHGNSEPLAGNLDNYQLGFCDKTNHLFIKNGKDEVIDIMGWISAGTGTKVDTLQDFFGEIVWRMYFEGNLSFISVSIIHQQQIVLLDKNNKTIPIKYLVGQGGFGKFNIYLGKDLKTKLPILNGPLLYPFGIYRENTYDSDNILDSINFWPFVKNEILHLEYARHTSNVYSEFSYKIYVDFTDGTVRQQA
jgi:hypothetical protein